MAYPDYDPSFTISRQVPAYTLPADAKPLFSWKPGAEDGGWSAGQMVMTEKTGGVLHITAKGGYPSIRTDLKETLAEGKYAVQVCLRVQASGRIRYGCGGRKAGAEVVEFSPPRASRLILNAGGPLIGRANRSSP